MRPGDALRLALFLLLTARCLADSSVVIVSAFAREPGYYRATACGATVDSLLCVPSPITGEGPLEWAQRCAEIPTIERR